MVRAYFLLNLLLAAGAAGVTGWILTREDPAYRPAVNHRTMHESDDDSEAGPAVRSQQRPRLPQTNYEILWEDVLFHPDRREGVEITDAAEGTDVMASPANMELLAI